MKGWRSTTKSSWSRRARLLRRCEMSRVTLLRRWAWWCWAVRSSWRKLMNRFTGQLVTTAERISTRLGWQGEGQ